MPVHDGLIVVPVSTQIYGEGDSHEAHPHKVTNGAEEAKLALDPGQRINATMKQTSTPTPAKVGKGTNHGLGAQRRRLRSDCRTFLASEALCTAMSNLFHSRALTW